MGGLLETHFSCCTKNAGAHLFNPQIIMRTVRVAPRLRQRIGGETEEKKNKKAGHRRQHSVYLWALTYPQRLNFLVSPSGTLSHCDNTSTKHCGPVIEKPGRVDWARPPFSTSLIIRRRSAVAPKSRQRIGGETEEKKNKKAGHRRQHSVYLWALTCPHKLCIISSPSGTLSHCDNT